VENIFLLISVNIWNSSKATAVYVRYG